MPASTYERDNRLNVLRGVAYPSPAASYWVSLHTDDPGPLGSSELTGDGYERVEVAAEAASWSAPATAGLVRRIANANLLAFGPATASWITATHVGLWDAETSGNFVRSAELDDPRSVGSGDTIRFPAGQLVWTEE